MSVLNIPRRLATDDVIFAHGADEHLISQDSGDNLT